jgi:8-oxo-dGTP pyrophosphatase MutT (NUDIX family)
MKIRKSIKVILVNPRDEIVLVLVDDPRIVDVNGKYNGPFWNLVGGALEDGETPKETALREIYEEIGIDPNKINLGHEVYHGEVVLQMVGNETLIDQRFFVASTTVENLDLSHLTEDEKGRVKTTKWFSLNDVKNSKETIHPKKLAEYLDPILDGDIPKNSIRIEL